ncbi:MAG: hypothetical protein CL843_16320 [Crocinitomicaceae bacterium]|nr:hypothetical protein [Crocinitomicaceae bacterium]|tara:strand:- start:5516 stop:5701 length:186 start_codon:yes stop_codon:yes gene_type:complete
MTPDELKEIDVKIEKLNSQLVGDVFHDADIMEKIKKLEANKEGRELTPTQCDMNNCESCSG